MQGRNRGNRYEATECRLPSTTGTRGSTNTVGSVKTTSYPPAFAVGPSTSISASPPPPIVDTTESFLLVAVEGFDIAEGADIMDLPEERFTELLDEASRDISRQVATDIMIIEDEPLIAMDLEALVEGLGHNVIGVARTRTEAVKIAGEGKRPGLILADIQLADGSSGLDAVNDLLKSFEVPVIFITAYPERFLTGERPEPAFLIAKPFQPANVSAVISQALFFQQSARRREVRATA